MRTTADRTRRGVGDWGSGACSGLPATIGNALDSEYDIAVRVGIHCAPDAHKTIGSYPAGAVRMSPGFFSAIAAPMPNLPAKPPPPTLLLLCSVPNLVIEPVTM